MASLLGLSYPTLFLVSWNLVVQTCRRAQSWAFLCVYGSALHSARSLVDPESGSREGLQGKTMDWDALDGPELDSFYPKTVLLTFTVTLRK